MPVFPLLKEASTAAIISLLLLGAGCVTGPQPTPSQAAYYETPAGPGTFRIAYRGTEAASNQYHLDRMLLHACHVAKEREFSHFAVVDEDSTVPGQVVYCSGLNHFNLIPNRGLIVQCFSERPKRMFSFDCSQLEKVLTEKLNLNR